MADRPVIPVPGQDYMLAVPEDAEVVIDEAAAEHEIDFERNRISIRVSREMALDFGLVEPTDEERAERAARHEAFLARQAIQRALPARPLTLEALLEALGWSAVYAQHWLHPACSCDPLSEDPYLCPWARELGFTEVGGVAGG